MWWRWRNGANSGMVPPRGRGSRSRGRTHGRNVLSGDSGGCKSRHGVAVVAGKVAAVVAGTEAVEPGLEPPIGGEEDCLTLGWKLCPPLVFTMAGLKKERRWRG